MEIEGAYKPWFRKGRYIFLLAVLIALILISLFAYLPSGPVPPKQVRLNMTIAYFAHNYNSTTGLIHESPGSKTYWLFSDNYLAVLAISRYDPRNTSTGSFAVAVDSALFSYYATLPPTLSMNQYTALNSTSTSFDCSGDYTLSWLSGNQLVSGSGSATLMTTSNNLGPSCASQNYADLLFLQALYYHRLGNSSGAMAFYAKGAADYNGVGVVDLASNATLYQTFKLALYIFTSSCLGQTSGSGFGAAWATLFALQDNSTGGFYTGYTVVPSHSGATVYSHGSTMANTETTALAALAIEQVLKPSTSC